MKSTVIGLNPRILMHQSGVPHALGILAVVEQFITYLRFQTGGPIAVCVLLASKGFLYKGHHKKPYILLQSYTKP